MRITALISLVIALSLSVLPAWSQETKTDTSEPDTAAVGQNEQETASSTPRKHKCMMKGHLGKGGHGMKHGGKGVSHGHGMKHGHHQDVLQRLERIEQRQILIETMLRQLLLDKN